MGTERLGDLEPMPAFCNVTWESPCNTSIQTNLFAAPACAV
jgi:hypothetical protein